MKITKMGIKPEDRVWRGACEECKAVAEAKESEMTRIEFCYREYRRVSIQECPSCGDGSFGKPGKMKFCCIDAHEMSQSDAEAFCEFRRQLGMSKEEKEEEARNIEAIRSVHRRRNE